MKSSRKRHIVDKCVTCGMKVNRNKAHIRIELRGETYLACCPLCQSEFEKNPERYVIAGKNRNKKR